MRGRKRPQLQVLLGNARILLSFFNFLPSIPNIPSCPLYNAHISVELQGERRAWARGFDSNSFPGAQELSVLISGFLIAFY